MEPRCKLRNTCISNLCPFTPCMLACMNYITQEFPIQTGIKLIKLHSLYSTYNIFKLKMVQNFKGKTLLHIPVVLFPARVGELLCQLG